MDWWKPMKQSEYLHLVTERVIAKLQELNRCSVPIGVSNRHVHVSKEAYNVLFGQDELTKKVDLKQPGQYAANETVTLVGPKGSIEKVRILGPFRNDTQVEISLTDSFTLGVPGVIRESGDLRETPGITLLGPKGKLTISQGVIVAHRHIHMHPDDAKRMGVIDKERVTVTVHGERELTFSNVIIRVSPKFALEMHIDVDEANAGRIKNNDIGIVSKS